MSLLDLGAAVALADVSCRRREFLWATLFVYGTSIVMRFGLLVVRNGSKIPMASVEALADNALRITIQCPPGHRWKAGQHFFLNFMKAAPFESHPYTIANAPYLHPNAQVSPLVARA